ncbi:minor tail protein [Mycobacterium phage NoShow]|nr:minor tail protein [Mycobacterium phage NoShow]
MAGWTSTPTPQRKPAGWTANPEPELTKAEGWFGTRSYPKNPPAAQAGAVALAPSVVLDIIGVPVPPALATAVALAPTPKVGFTGAIPVAQAAATALSPSARVDTTPAAPSASAGGTALPPVPTLDVNVTSPPATAAGTAVPPQIIISHIADVDAAAAAATGLPPAVRVDVVAAIPPAVGGANAVAPGGGWSQPPTVTQYTTAGTFTFNIPVWCNFIDYGLWGGGRGGRGGGPALPGGAGAAGQQLTGTLQRGVHFSSGATQLTIVIAPQSIGSSGAYAVIDPSPEGGPTVIREGTTALVQANGATTEVSGQTGQSAGALVVNGISYPGGTGGTQNNNATGNGSGGGGGAMDFGFAPGSKGGNGSVGKAVLVARSN